MEITGTQLSGTTLTFPSQGAHSHNPVAQATLPSATSYQFFSKNWNRNQPTFQVLGEQVLREHQARQAAVLGPRPIPGSPELPLPGHWLVCPLCTG